MARFQIVTSSIVCLVFAVFLVTCIKDKDKRYCEKPDSFENNNRVLLALISKIENNKNLFNSQIIRGKNNEILSIALANEDITDINLKAISTVKSMQSLVLACRTDDYLITPKSFQYFYHSKELKRIHLYGAVETITLEMCKSLSNIDKLELLEISFCDFEKEGVDFLKENGISVKIDDQIL